MYARSTACLRVQTRALCHAFLSADKSKTWDGKRGRGQIDPVPYDDDQKEYNMYPNPVKARVFCKSVTSPLSSSPSPPL